MVNAVGDVDGVPTDDADGAHRLGVAWRTREHLAEPVDGAGEGEEAIRRQELQVCVRERIEIIHVTAGARECDAVSRVKIHIDVPFDQPG